VESSAAVLVKKAALGRELTHDHAIYLDSDTIVRAPVDEFLGWTREFGFVATWFAGWSTTGGMMRGRIEEWSHVAPDLVPAALAYGKAINSGVQGWSKGAAILPAYEELTRRGAEAGCRRIFLDEIALQLLLPRHRHYLAHPVWNTSGKFGNLAEAKIVHYHGNRHGSADNPRCDLWKAHYFELLHSFPEHRATLGESWGDKRLRGYLRTVSKPRRDLTVVTAVDPAYARKLERNLRRWMAVPGLKEQQFLVFVNGFKGPHERRFLNYPNVKVVRWNYGHAEANRREFMLAAFIFGVAEHVKTRFWMKLDADVRPARPWWEWPDYGSYTIVSHRWGFTRMKGDEETRHWFHRLDDIFRLEEPFFNGTFSPGQGPISHRPGNRDGLPPRFNSFCHIEKTTFTRRIAKYLRVHAQGRMPIPSQDTTSWYCSVIWSEPVKLINMKKWIKN
jgi:hypothetical protein